MTWSFSLFPILMQVNSKDTVATQRQQMIKHIYDLLNAKPEQERTLLSLIINKFVRSLASRVLVSLCSEVDSPSCLWSVLTGRPREKDLQQRRVPADESAAEAPRDEDGRGEGGAAAPLPCQRVAPRAVRIPPLLASFAVFATSLKSKGGSHVAGTVRSSS
jgi:hypothetical protein